MPSVVHGWGAELIAGGALTVMLVFAVARPRQMSEAVVAVPAAVLVLGLGLITPTDAAQRVQGLAPTLAFLAAVLVLAHLADSEGVFEWLGSRLATISHGGAKRLLVLTFLAAAVTTAVLSLDATVVLLTPVIFTTAVTLRLRPKPHVYACAHLANSASTLMPVSNLTNLLAFSMTGLSFAAFTGLMALPWLSVIAVELAVFRFCFRTDLTADHNAGSAAVVPTRATPWFALVVLALVLAGFAAGSTVDLAPVWPAGVGALVLAVRGLHRRTVRLQQIIRETSPGFLLFVLAVSVAVQAMADNGLRAALGALLPATAGFFALLGVAVLATVLANLVNNLPATLVLLAALGPHPYPGVVLAMLLGVNLGPNATYAGSLATLLWRRVLARHGAAAWTMREFLRLGAATVPASLVAGVATLWIGLRAVGL